MLYIQFYKNSTGYIPGTIPPKFDPAYVTLVEACGSDGVLPVDGRLAPRNVAALAEEASRNRGYHGYAIFRGASFSTAVKLSGPWRVVSGGSDTTASSATHGA